MSSVKDNLFKVNIYTPNGICFSENCECVNFCINAGRDDGDFGSYGVKKGHANAVFSIGEGVISVKREGKVLYSVNNSEGFAVMDKGMLNITLEKVWNK